MTRTLSLPYGTRPYALRIDPDRHRVDLVEPPRRPPPNGLDAAPPNGLDNGPRRPPNGPDNALAAALRAALDHPIDAPRLRDAVAPGAAVVVIVSDATRDEPRSAMLRAVLDTLPPDIDLTVAIATGTHGPAALPALALDPDLVAGARIVNHDALRHDDLVLAGTTTRGTPMRVHRCVLDADWTISTGRIKPHYFAGYGAGIKGIFPGLGANAEIRINHALKQQPGARAGVIDGNPCREDAEEIIEMLPGTPYILNVIADDTGAVHSAVAGHPRAAFREGARRCRPLYEVTGTPCETVIVSDALPLTASLYQASKLVAAAADLLVDGGTMVLAAECPDGTGPIDTVNAGIYDIGLRPRLPAAHRIVLVSGLSRDIVGHTYCEWAPSVEHVLAAVPAGRVVVVPRASSLLIEATHG